MVCYLLFHLFPCEDRSSTTPFYMNRKVPPPHTHFYKNISQFLIKIRPASQQVKHVDRWSNSKVTSCSSVQLIYVSRAHSSVQSPCPLTSSCAIQHTPCAVSRPILQSPDPGSYLTADINTLMLVVECNALWLVCEPAGWHPDSLGEARPRKWALR